MTILQDVKRSLGPMLGEAFDEQIIGLIDTALLPLVQVGAVDLTQSLTVDTEWNDILVEPPKTQNITTPAVLSAVTNYTYLIVRLMFDPPASSVAQIVKEKADEQLWRLEVAYHVYS